MEGVIYSNTSTDKTIDYIELLLDECRNIFCWTTQDIYNELKPTEDNVWEKHVFIMTSPTVNSIGDCLRELYIRDESRDTLIVIGNTDVPMPKLSLHKNLNKKHVAVLLFGDGNVSIDIKGGAINSYKWDGEVNDPLIGTRRVNDKKGRIMEIAYCTSIILSIFQDNFDCNTFHDLILSGPVGYTFGAVMDKRLKHFDNNEPVVNEGAKTFIEELKEMCESGTVHSLELNCLRLAHGLSYDKLKSSLQELGHENVLD